MGVNDVGGHGSPSIPPIQVFRPSLEDMKDFSKYIEYIESQGAHKGGLAKIIPPKEYRPRASGYDNIDDLLIKHPIKQHVQGSQGLYQQFNMTQRHLTVKEFRQKAESKKFMTPLHADEEELERKYWANITYTAPIYGADVPGTLTDDEFPLFNINKLGTILDMINESYGIKIMGVNTAYLYFGMWKTTFPWHTEDMDLYSINYLHFGAPKSWYCIPPEHGKRLERLAAQFFSESHSRCKAFLRHKMTLISPTTLKKYGIPYNKITQNAGEFMITFPYAYHAGYNHGYNCAESTNFALPRWIEFGKRATRCYCRKDSVKISMETFVKHFQPEKYDNWLNGKDWGQDPKDGHWSNAPLPDEYELNVLSKVKSESKRQPSHKKIKAEESGSDGSDTEEYGSECEEDSNSNSASRNLYTSQKCSGPRLGLLIKAEKPSASSSQSSESMQKANEDSCEQLSQNGAPLPSGPRILSFPNAFTVQEVTIPASITRISTPSTSTSVSYTHDYSHPSSQVQNIAHESDPSSTAEAVAAATSDTHPPDMSSDSQATTEQMNDTPSTSQETASSEAGMADVNKSSQSSAGVSELPPKLFPSTSSFAGPFNGGSMIDMCTSTEGTLIDQKIRNSEAILVDEAKSGVDTLHLIQYLPFTFELEKRFNIDTSRIDPHCSICLLLKPFSCVQHTPIDSDDWSPPKSSQILIPSVAFTKDDDIDANVKATLEAIDKAPLLVCKICRVCVHSVCYGVCDEKFDGHESDWLCDRCSEAYYDAAACCMCPYRGGALKKCKDDSWAHVTCALLVQGVVFQDQIRKGPIVITPKAEAFKSGKYQKNGAVTNCAYCRLSLCNTENQLANYINGYCVQCNARGSCKPFHVSCGHRHGVKYQAGDWPHPIKIMCKNCTQRAQARESAALYKEQGASLPQLEPGTRVWVQRKIYQTVERATVKESRRERDHSVHLEDNTIYSGLTDEDFVGFDWDASPSGPEIGDSVEIRWKRTDTLRALYAGHSMKSICEIEFDSGATEDYNREEVYGPNDQMPQKMKRKIETELNTSKKRR